MHANGFTIRDAEIRPKWKRKSRKQGLNARMMMIMMRENYESKTNCTGTTLDLRYLNTYTKNFPMKHQEQSETDAHFRF